MARKFLLLAVCLAGMHAASGQLPVWPIVTAAEDYLSNSDTVHNQFIDWGVPAPGSTLIPNAFSHFSGSAQAGINACNDMVFFVLHNGRQPQDSAFLRLFLPNGTYMPLPGGDMNANSGDDEVQVVRRPGTTDQWFVVYSMAPPGPPWWGNNPGYEASRLGYSLIQISGATANYVSDLSGPIHDRILAVGTDTLTYIHGKATSRFSVVPGANHDIYVQRRAMSDPDFVIDRFTIDNNDSVYYTGSSDTINGYWWSLMVAGSPIEISPDDSSLAVLNRTDVNGQTRIYVFDISSGTSLSNAPDEIIVDELEIQFTAIPPGMPGLFNQAQLFDTATVSGFNWLRNFERKIGSIEFSPNGDYLYIGGGGYTQAAFGNISYLGQINLDTLIGTNHTVRLQVQMANELDSLTNVNQGRGLSWPALGPFANYYLYHGVSNIESCINGNFYFCKANTDTMYVLPTPDNPLPISMTPHNIDFGVLGNPDIIMQEGWVGILPDQIDGWDYSDTDFVSVTLIVSNQFMCGDCDTMTVTVTSGLVHHGTQFQTSFFIDSCPDTITICLPATGTFDLQGPNGVVYFGAVTNGVVNYPPGGVFNFGSPPVSPGSASVTVINGTNNYINSDIMWEGKFYVEDNTIVTVDNATLDLTNVDIIFGECSGIDFINGGHVRANNSVFRPCAIDGTWRGFYLNGFPEYDNLINECTFKNAEIALHFDWNADGIISNNLFSNCNEGVNISSVPNFNHPISGNNFVADDLWPVFQNCTQVTNPFTFYGILVNGSHLSAEIAHNDFICSKNSDPLLSIGIAVGKGSANISENVFTNMRNPIALSRPMEMYIDGNEIEYTNNFVAYASANPTSGIYVNQSNAIVEVSNNELRNNSNATVYGIYAAKGMYVSARRNNIDGFTMGIYFKSMASVEITENVVTNAIRIGIYYEDFLRLYTNYITCNDVTMHSFAGYGIRVESANQLTRIISNCVKDAGTGIYTGSLGGAPDTIPYIRNNYLYNYYSGIYNYGHVGTIGAAGDPGLNTLWSNDNTATDISSTPNTIFVADNFGMFNITFPQVLISSNNPYHSTASCGHQIYNMPSQGNLNTNWVCDNAELVYYPMERSGSSVTVNPDDLAAALDAAGDPLLTMIAVIQSVSNPDEQQLSALISAHFTDANDRNLLLSYLYMRLGNYVQAGQYLGAYTPVDAEDALRKQLETLYISRLQDSAFDLGDQVEMLKALADAQGPLAHIATTLLQFTTQHALYPYTKEDDPVTDPTLKTIHVGDNVILSAYPNPAQDMITIGIVTDEETSDYTLQLLDVTGKLLLAKPVQFVAGQLQLDLGDLSSGMYLISIINPDEAHSIRFVKE